jgi:hypothetical protein
MDLARATHGRARLVIATRIALVIAAACAVVAAVIAARDGGPARRFACPMHSEVTADQPGDCPICGMALVLVGPGGAPALPAAPAGDAETVALAAVRSSPEAQSMLRFSIAPAHRDVIPGEVFAPARVALDGTIAAQLYRDQLSSLAVGEAAELIPAAASSAPIPIVRTAQPPDTPADPEGLARVSFRAAPGHTAPPGLIGWVKLAYKTRPMLVVRSVAVVHAADGPYVLVFSAQRGQLIKRRVELGQDYGGMTAIVSGLRDRELVVMSNTFALDAERRQRAAP